MTNEASLLDEALWRLPTLLERTGLSVSEITRLEKDGQFPPRRRIGERAVAWLASEVVFWMRSHPMAADACAANPPPRSRGRPRKHPLRTDTNRESDQKTDQKPAEIRQ